jgi:D-sedoheptulose 7-phosphate isomerase
MIESRFEEHHQVIRDMGKLIPQIERTGQELSDRLRGGGKVLWLGNGGSAADSQHMAAELVGRFERDRAPFASIALTTDTSILTAISNDYGYDQVFSRQVDALCLPGDVVIGISTSGNSKSVLLALEAGRTHGSFVVGLTGRDGGAMKDLCDECLIVPSDRTARIQEGHLLIGHCLCDIVETTLSES